jgi:glyoxylase I family protein
MKIEHIGYLVADPPLVAQWYMKHLGFWIARKQDEAPFTHFLVDSAGHGIIEIYNNPAAAVPDYAKQDPLVLHLAFAVGNETIEAACDRLLAAGATVAQDFFTTAAGDRLIMLRDPWGFPIQLARRKQSLA